MNRNWFKSKRCRSIHSQNFSTKFFIENIFQKLCPQKPSSKMLSKANQITTTLTPEGKEITKSVELSLFRFLPQHHKKFHTMFLITPLR